MPQKSAPKAFPGEVESGSPSGNAQNKDSRAALRFQHTQNGSRRFFLGERDTPTGLMRIVWDEDGAIRSIDWADYDSRMRKLLARHYGAEGKGFTLEAAPLPKAIAAAIDAYFKGDLTAIDALPVALEGTEFQQAVWTALRNIPAGQTMSYGALAARIGREKAVRAVGLANGSNPIPLVVPCHRVIGADGTLTGYGGGLDRKRWLLTHEGIQVELPLGA